jgi:hypothetical protein
MRNYSENRTKGWAGTRVFKILTKCIQSQQFFLFLLFVFDTFYAILEICKRDQFK